MANLTRYSGSSVLQTVEYRYSAGGSFRASIERNAAGAVTREVYHVDGHRYDATARELYYAHAEGASLVDATFNTKLIGYHTDHLGNVILAYSDLNGNGGIDPATEFLEEQQYWPYGMAREGYASANRSLPFAFNGAEREDRLGLHLTTYRTMASETGLWGQVDPKAEAMPSMSPYSVNRANPISYSDPHGDLFFIIPQIGIGSGGVSFGVEVGIGVPGVASLSATVGAGTGGAYWSVQGSAVGLYAGYGSNGGFAGYGFNHGGLTAGVHYGANGPSVGIGYGAGHGNGYASSIGISYGRGGLSYGASVSSMYAWGGVQNMLGGDSQGEPASVHEDLEYSPEFVADFWEKKFGDVERVNKFTVDGAGPTDNYVLGPDGHTRYKGEIAYGSTVSSGKKSNVYFYRGAFDSPQRLYLTVGHEYIHTAFNWHGISAEWRTEEATAYSWNYQVARNMSGVPASSLKHIQTQWSIYKRHYDRRYNFLTP